jgi:hypothetical protein
MQRMQVRFSGERSHNTDPPFRYCSRYAHRMQLPKAISVPLQKWRPAPVKEQGAIQSVSRYQPAAMLVMYPIDGGK